MTNEIMMQYFEWYLPNDGKHWQHLAEDASHLKNIGISKVWMPPAFKGTGSNDVGYGVYDLYDLGEFNQNGTVRTKYGSREDYLNAVNALKEQEIMPISDIVLNHKANGDAKERFQVVKVNPSNRQEKISEPYEIEGWTQFNFPGRQDNYSDFKWHWYHFTGVDYDALHNENGIYMILGDNKGWASQENIDQENGNYDYLMYDDIDFKHPEVQEHLRDWVAWFLETSGVGGFRLDAIKHIDKTFMAQFIRYIREHLKADLYVFGEYWKDSHFDITDYLHSVDLQFDLIDVMLHMNFFEAGQKGSDFDLSTILDDSLMKSHPDFAVTFVDNHDSQKGQALESTVAEWFKPLAYGLILLRQEGIPCVFYGDYYGISGEFAQESFQTVLDKLLYIRQYHVYGPQEDYFDYANCIGWTCLGDEEHPDGVAVIMSNGEANCKRMNMGEFNRNKVFVDYLNNCTEEVILDDQGWGDFPVQEASLSAWVNKDAH
ncbi:alpha-amylase [Streptococcus mutans]|uniref:alpha-amylase n=1 Tax=Streptococcus mutans TaxID=1309 RepID=UPI0002D94D75|nr:alpha-amylase [Streptococcus mutans]QIQ93365.1 alpha-amylase [Streptococcus mutans]QIQ99607.1 alpha-amylase [Streptococcus mutans]QIR01257.1 alpha-amylase [Streptococcus mutans]QIR03385.1 alpha-amylase [Streptococcus mutans]